MKFYTRTLILCLSLLFLIRVDSKEARVCLNMIVKNEQHVIQRALASVKPLIDYWVIVDTGSSDTTKELILKSLQDVPGELHERPWRDFGYNRTEALQLAQGKADYILFLDADDWLEYDSPFALPRLDIDIYWAKWQSLRVPSFSYLKPLLVKDSLPCHWEGVIHEYITYDHASSQTTLDGMIYIFTGEGSRSKNPKKYEEAAQTLEHALHYEPGNPRYMFYLAESYRDADDPIQALSAYQKRIALGGWEEEIFWSLLQIGHLKKMLNYSSKDVMASYLQAHHHSPSRIEPVYYLAELYNQDRDYELAYKCIKNWQLQPKASLKNLLFCLGWIDDYGLPFQLSIAAYYVQKYQESLDLNDQLLTNPRLSEALRKQVIINREFSLRYCKSAYRAP